MKCSICKKRIFGRYYQDLWKRTYCPQHYNSSKHCPNCGAPLSRENTVSYYDQKKFCRRCVTSSPEKLSTIKKIYRKAKGVLAEEGFRIPESKVNLKRKYSGPPGTAELKWNYSSINGDYQKYYNIHIRVGGPSKSSIYSTLAHEIGHVFTYYHSKLKGKRKQKNHLYPPTITSKLGEGFSNYLSLIALKRVENGFLRPSFKKNQISGLQRDKYVQAIDKFVERYSLGKLRRKIIEECQNEGVLVLPIGERGQEGDQGKAEVKVEWRYLSES